MLGRTDSRRRMLVLLVVFLVVGASLGSRLVWWQVVKHEELAGKALSQSTTRYEEPVRRGTVFDRSGTVVLATTVDRYRLVAAPNQMTAAQRTAVGAKLVAILGLDGDPAKALTDRIDPAKAYVVLTRGIDEATADKVREASAIGDLPFIRLEPEPVRVYPQAGGANGTTLAAHLLGFVNREGQGQYGVEERYQEDLAGTPRTVLAERDVQGQPVLDTAQVIDPGTPGQDIRLTIDADLQLLVEQELLAAYTADRAVSVSAVVMDPATGAILSEASFPSYDAQRLPVDRHEGSRRSSSTRSSRPSTSRARSSRCSPPWPPTRRARPARRPGCSTRVRSRSTAGRAGSTTRTSTPTG